MHEMKCYKKAICPLVKEIIDCEIDSSGIATSENQTIYYIIYLSNVHDEVCFKLFSQRSRRQAILHCLLKFDI